METAKKRRKKGIVAPRPRVSTTLRARPNPRVISDALRVDDTVKKLGEKGRLVFRRRPR